MSVVVCLVFGFFCVFCVCVCCCWFGRIVVVVVIVDVVVVVLIRTDFILKILLKQIWCPVNVNFINCTTNAFVLVAVFLECFILSFNLEHS